MLYTKITATITNKIATWEEHYFMVGKVDKDVCVEKMYNMVKFFNDTLQPHESERKLIDVKTSLTYETNIRPAQLIKMNEYCSEMNIMLRTQ